MTTYTLTVIFNEAGLKILHDAGEVVSIVKAVGSNASGASVVWVSFKVCFWFSLSHIFLYFFFLPLMIYFTAFLTQHYYMDRNLWSLCF